MKPTHLPDKIAALFLALCLAMPSPVFALRQQELETKEQRAGLERALASGPAAGPSTVLRAGLEQDLEFPQLYPVIRMAYPAHPSNQEVITLSFNPKEKIIIFALRESQSFKADVVKEIMAFEVSSRRQVTIHPNIIAGLKDMNWPPAKAIFTADGQTLYVRLKSHPKGDDWQRIVGYDWSTGRKLDREIRLEDSLNWQDMAVSPDGKTLYAVSARFLRPPKEFFIRSFDLETGGQRGKDIRFPALQPTEWPIGLLPNPDGRRLHVYFSQSQNVRTYDLVAHRWVGRTLHIEVPGNGVNSISLSGDGSLLYVGTILWSFLAYDLESTEKSQPISTPLNPIFLAIDSDGVLTAVSMVWLQERGINLMEVTRSVPAEGAPLDEVPSMLNVRLPSQNLPYEPAAGLEQDVLEETLAGLASVANPANVLVIEASALGRLDWMEEIFAQPGFAQKIVLFGADSAQAKELEARYDDIHLVQTDKPEDLVTELLSIPGARDVGYLGREDERFRDFKSLAERWGFNLSLVEHDASLRAILKALGVPERELRKFNLDRLERGLKQAA